MREPVTGDSLPPCGGGVGRGVHRGTSASRLATTPTPHPTPQGGGEKFGARGEHFHVPLAFFLISAVFVALNTVHLAALYAAGEWIVDRAGHYMLADFVTLWSAGKLVLDGQVAGVY